MRDTMTRYSASRGIMYRAPPSEDAEDETAERATESADPVPADD